MKKFLTLSLAMVLILSVTSCSASTKATTAVTTGQETTTITSETTIETVVETTVESTLNYYKIDSTESTTETKETVKKKTTTTTSADTTETATATIVVNNRQVTGDGGRLSFQTGDTVLGAAIEINGKTFPNCVIKNAPMGGIVISGVIWPWESEMSGLTLVSNDEILASIPDPTTTPTETTTIPTETVITKTRTLTGAGQSLAFQVGDTVVGWSISVNGTTYEGGVVLYNSPYSGTVVDGVINPWTSEITTQTVISP